MKDLNEHLYLISIVIFDSAKAIAKYHFHDNLGKWCYCRHRENCKIAGSIRQFLSKSERLAWVVRP